jgi:phage host-nuclease inhibitor protein Gam
VTVEELFTKFGNWLLTLIGAGVAYIIWRERTVSKVAELGKDIGRLEADINRLHTVLEDRSRADASVAAALATIQAQLAHLTAAVGDLRQELKTKADKER